MNAYKILVDGKGIIPDGSTKELEVKARTPARGLKLGVEAAGLTLASQDGRYGKLDDGRSVMAATMPWGRRRLDPMERQTRPR